MQQNPTFIIIVGSSEDQYPLNISGFDSIGLTDPFNFHASQNGMKFTSRDRDNDLRSDNCAHYYGGFWHSNCGGFEINDDPNDDASILYLNGQWYGTTLVEMKVRPKNCVID